MWGLRILRGSQSIEIEVIIFRGPSSNANSKLCCIHRKLRKRKLWKFYGNVSYSLSNFWLQSLYFSNLVIIVFSVNLKVSSKCSKGHIPIWGRKICTCL